jgi:tRNA 5-methylaminomethyl-2-thiouridine biosynthesis bifunctional protein
MLIFMIGEIADTAQSFHEVMRQQGVSYIDAFYLDGFAPSCNPQMWSEEVFGAFRLCSGASTTLSSFSVAGAVKRALRSAGFNVSKRKGFGQKREMLIGSVSSDSEN